MALTLPIRTFFLTPDMLLQIGVSIGSGTSTTYLEPFPGPRHAVAFHYEFNRYKKNVLEKWDEQMILCNAGAQPIHTGISTTYQKPFSGLNTAQAWHNKYHW